MMQSTIIFIIERISIKKSVGQDKPICPASYHTAAFLLLK